MTQTLTNLKIPEIAINGVLLDKNTVKIEGEGKELVLKETLFGEKITGFINPLEAFLAGLIGCELIMYRMLYEMLGYTGDLEMEISTAGSFKIGYGLESLRIRYYIKGLEEQEARAILELVKAYCPVFGTIKRAGVSISEELILR